MQHFITEMEWRCVFDFCVLTAISLRILLSHLNQVHSDKDFHIVCGLGDIPACHKISYNTTVFTSMLEGSMMTFTKAVQIVKDLLAAGIASQ